MKNLKIFGIVMMLVMGMNFTSCSSDDEPGASTDSINKYFEGEWFLVEEREEETDDDTELIKWDYDNQTAYGIDTYSGVYPYWSEKLYVRHIEGNTYQLNEEYCYEGVWETYTSTPIEYELVGNVIYEEVERDYRYKKGYIKSISENTLVIVEEQKWPDGEEEIDTKTYRRNN